MYDLIKAVCERRKIILSQAAEIQQINIENFQDRGFSGRKIALVHWRTFRGAQLESLILYQVEENDWRQRLEKILADNHIIECTGSREIKIKLQPLTEKRAWDFISLLWSWRMIKNE